jgi:uncharacterized protein YjbI with pentapeptide repeats
MRVREGDIGAVGASAAASVMWRLEGQLHLTCVLKAAFGLRPDGAMELLEKAPVVVRRDVHHEGLPTNSLVLAADDAPYLERVDVVFVGHAHAPEGRAVPQMRVRMALYGEGPLIDKSLEVVGNRKRHGDAPVPFVRMPIVYERALRDPEGLRNPVGVFEGPANVGRPRTHLPDGFGPVSRFWRQRRQRVDPGVVSRLDAPIGEIPRRFDWSYFQIAPSDQRVAELRGDEWLLLEGLTKSAHRMRSQLPSPRVTMWAWSVEGSPEAGWPIRMVADTLFVEGDAQRCTVTWRGAFPIRSEEVLRSLALAGGVETDARPIDWKAALSRIAEDRRPRRVVVPVSFDRGALSVGTLSAPKLDATIGVSDIRLPPLPFAGSVAAVPPTTADERGEDTLTGTLAVASTFRREPATPFDDTSVVDEDSLTGTMGIAAHFTSQDAVPFDTSGARHDEGLRIAATPFDRSSESSSGELTPSGVVAAIPPAPALASPPLASPPSLAIPAPPALADALPPVARPVAERSAKRPDAMNETRAVSEATAAQLLAPFPIAAARPALVPADIPGAPWAAQPIPTAKLPTPYEDLGATMAIARALEAGGPALELPERKAQTVPIENDSELLAATQIWELAPGRTTLTVMVKGTFDLVPDHAAVPAAKSDYPLGDQYVDDDPTGSLIRASDYAVFKPRADVTLAGTVHPVEPLARRAEVRFVFGEGEARFDRRLVAFGERMLEPRPSGDVIGRPEPFESLPLRYDHAFGGEGFDLNPVGTGFSAEPKPVRMPRIEDPAALVQSRADRPTPAGFGPISLAWQPRRGLLGTFDQPWLRERWPFFPADFDPAFFQVAPKAQQLPHLRGDEPFRIEGMHPQHPVLVGRLPLMRARVCSQRTPSGDDDPRDHFHEHPAVLDTVHFDVDAMRLELVWRAHFDVRDGYASDLSALFVTAEPSDAAPATEDSLFHRFLVLHGKRPSPPPDGQAANDGAQLEDVEADLDQARSAREKAIAGAGLPEAPPMMAPAIPRPVAGSVSAERSRVEALLEGGGSLVGVGLAGVDLSGIDLSRRDLTRANLTGAVLRGALLRAADLSGAQLAQADLTDADLTAAHLPGADLTDAVLDRACFEKAALDKAAFDDARGSECRFGEARGSKASFAGASLRLAQFSGATLDGADFSKADLEGAVLDGASLRDAKIYDARAVGSSWQGCDLTDFRAEGAVFDSAHLERVKATGSMWEGAVLDAAHFDGAALEGAAFVRVSAPQASFAGARLQGARFKEATLVDARFVGANLMRASFGGADLSGADFSGANLFSAETWRATLDRARFDEAILVGTKLAPPREEESKSP